MTVTVNSSGTQACTIGTEHTLATITTSNVFELQLDTSAIVGGATPDILEVREYMKVLGGGTEQLRKVHVIRGAQSQQCFTTVPRMSATSIRYSIKQTQGTGRSIPWGITQAQ